MNKIPQENKIKDLEERLKTLEFFTVFFFSIMFAITFSFLKEQGILLNINSLIAYFLFYIGLAFLFIYIVIPIVRVVKKVGLSIDEILDEFVKEWKGKSRLNRTKTFFQIVIGIGGLLALINLFLD